MAQAPTVYRPPPSTHANVGGTDDYGTETAVDNAGEPGNMAMDNGAELPAGPLAVGVPSGTKRTGTSALDNVGVDPDIADVSEPCLG